jgi:alkylation response protein AidB-like acyl-CoA dehydrogenase
MTVQPCAGVVESAVVLMKNDPKAKPPYKEMTCFITKKEPWAERNDGCECRGTSRSLGYKGVESTKLVYDGYACAPDRILGGRRRGWARGFGKMMDALEVDRVNVGTQSAE